MGFSMVILKKSLYEHKKCIKERIYADLKGFFVFLTSKRGM